MGNGKLIKKMQKFLKEKGKDAYEIAKKEILCEELEYKPVCDALHYFIEEVWQNFQHPALLSLTCEAVGGKTEKTKTIGAALVLLTGAADIHDDIIDHSKVKGAKPTVFGNFGQDIALITGDILFIKGLHILNRACEELPKKQGETVFNIVKKGFLKIGLGVANEADLKGRWNIAIGEYFEIVKNKAAIAEATARIGAFLGGGSQNEIEALAGYGRILGILATIRDDFIDTFEPDELANRAKNECLPLPVLYALKDSKVKKEIINLLKRDSLSEKHAYKIVEMAMQTEGAQSLKKEMSMLLQEGVTKLKVIKNKNVKKQLVDILHATLEDL